MLSKLFCSLVALLIAVNSANGNEEAQQIHYDGYAVYQIIPRNAQQVAILKNLSETNTQVSFLINFSCEVIFKNVNNFYGLL